MEDKEFKKARQAKLDLDAVSPSFCTVKWKHATLNLGAGAVKSCCHLPFRPVVPGSLAEGYQIHDTEEDRDERRQMQVGERPRDCSYCWWLEDQGHLSDRIVWSSKTWMAPFTPEVIAAQSTAAQTPAWLELNFSNLCNLKCSYCSPIFSSRWLQEIREHGPYPTQPGHNDLNYLSGVELNEKYDNSELMRQFWPWFENAYPQLRLLKVTGGEPFLSPHLYKILDWVLDHPNNELNLSINSNLSVPDGNWRDFMRRVVEIRKQKSVSRFYLHPSVDSFGARAEYIRHGLDFALFQTRVEDYLEQASGNLVFICTLNNLSLGGLLDFWHYILRLKKQFGARYQRISVTSEILMYPEWQGLNLLPDSFQTYFTDTIAFARQNQGDGINSFSEFEIQGLTRAMDMMRKPSLNHETAKANFFRFFQEHDRRRNTDILSVFPEMAQFWRESGDCAQRL